MLPQAGLSDEAVAGVGPDGTETVAARLRRLQDAFEDACHAFLLRAAAMPHFVDAYVARNIRAFVSAELGRPRGEYGEYLAAVIRREEERERECKAAATAPAAGEYG